MTDGGDCGHGCTLNRSVLNNVVLKSSYTAVGMSSLRFSHANPGSAAAQIDDLAELFKNVDMHIICISETWFKRWHTNKRIGIPDYKVSRSDRRDGRRWRCSIHSGIISHTRFSANHLTLASSTAYSSNLNSKAETYLLASFITHPAFWDYQSISPFWRTCIHDILIVSFLVILTRTCL
jgi:hypothetical protein